MKKENICNNINIAFGKVIESYLRNTGQYSQYKVEYNLKNFQNIKQDMSVKLYHKRIGIACQILSSWYIIKR